MASALAGKPAAFVNADVALDGEPVIGSFTVNGLTFAVTGESTIELVGVSPSVILSGGSEAAGAEGSDESHASEAGVASLTLPESITYEGVDYTLASIGGFAFYLSGVTDLTLPASVSDVDDRAFRSSDVASVAVAESNLTYSSYDGVLYDAECLSLLLIPEGKQGAVRIPAAAKAAPPSAFSHCAGVDAIAADAGGAAFASENGLLYDASLTTLLRVPAGATDIAIRDGCTAIAAGAMEGCAQLERITAPASVTSVSPDVFTSVPTVSLPAASAVADDPGASTGATEGFSEQAGSTPASDSTTTQLTAMVALSSTDDDLPEIDPAAIEVNLPEGADRAIWQAAGFSFAELVGGVGDGAAALGEADGSGPVASDLTERATSEVLDLEGFDWVQRYTPTSGLQLMLTDPLNGFWQASLTLNQPQSSVIVDVRGYNGKGLGDVTTKVTFTVSNFNAAQARNELNTYWSPNVGAYGYLYALMAGHYNSSVPSYGNTWLILSSTFTQSSFSFSCCGADMTTRSGTVPTLSNGTVDAFFRVKPSSHAMSTTYAHSFSPAPGTLNGSTAAVTTSCTNESLVVPSDPVPPKGYTFKGWYTAPAGGSQLSNGTREILNWRYFAQYEAIPYPVAFDLGSFPTSDEPGSFSQEGWGESRTFTVEDGTVELPSPVRAGMRFLSWECDQTGLLSQDGTAWALDCTALPDAPAPTLTARWSYVIDVDTPVAVTFGEYDMATGSVTVDGSANPGELDDGYDTASKRGEPVSFKSASKCDVGIEGLSCESREGIALIKAKAGQDADEQVRAAELITMQVGGGAPTSRNSVSFALDDALGKDDLAPATAFVIPAEGELSASFRLNLEECGAYVSDASAGPEPAEADLAQLTYAYRAIPYGTGEVDGAGACTEDMYIPYDAANPFGLADIKAAANDIASRGYDSEHWWLYKHLMYEDERNKTNARVKVGAAYHDVQILGLRQDKLSTPTDGRTYAGLTFGWRDIYSMQTMNAANPAGVGSLGWSYPQPLRTYLRGEFTASLPAAVRQSIMTVAKSQQLAKGGLQRSAETVFLPSMYEVFGTAFADHNGSEGIADAFQYQYFAQSGTKSINAAAMKPYNGLMNSWWLRSAYSSGTVDWNFGLVSDKGARWAGGTYYDFGVVPCFAL